MVLGDAPHAWKAEPLRLLPARSPLSMLDPPLACRTGMRLNRARQNYRGHNGGDSDYNVE